VFRQIASFEFRCHVRSALFWVTVLIFAMLAFGSIASDNVRIGGITGNVKKNSPFAVGVTLQTLAVFALFIMAAFVSNVVICDDETGYGQIVHSTRVSRFDYLFGRFTGAFAAGCAAFAGVPLGLMLGSFMPWLDPETLGARSTWLPDSLGRTQGPYYGRLTFPWSVSRLERPAEHRYAVDVAQVDRHLGRPGIDVHLAKELQAAVG
jgi:hypothetical protein